MGTKKAALDYIENLDDLQNRVKLGKSGESCERNESIMGHSGNTRENSDKRYYTFNAPELSNIRDVDYSCEIRELLDLLHDKYNTPNFIEADPISIPHSFSRHEDIEIGGFFAASIAWGNRKVIVKNGHRLMSLMDNSPYDFVMNASDNELNILTGYVHRTFNSDDCMDFVYALRGIYKKYGTLGHFFEEAYKLSGDIRVVLSRFRAEFWSFEHATRAEKHISSIDKGATCKRLNMYIRWMVRNDDRGVDLGLWRKIPASALYLPLDVHSASMGRSLGLLSRQQNDWRAVEEITSTLASFDSQDPIKYDFALFGAGIDGFLK